MTANATVPTQGRNLVWILLIAVVALTQLWIGGGLFLFDQPFRLDEVNTLTLVSDPSLTHALDALKQGADYNPPTLYVLMRAFTALWDVSEISLRTFSFLCLLIGLFGTFACLRLSYSPLISFAVVMLLWARPILMRQGMDARFYAAWFAALAWFTFFLARSSKSPSRLNSLGLAIAAALTCTIHYFGILTWGLVVAGHVLVHRPARRDWLAVAIGPLALLACLGFYLEQRAALTVSTWVKPPTIGSVTKFMRVWWPIMHVVVAFGLVAAARLSGALRPAPHGALRRLSGMSSNALLPFVLLAFSLVVQPVMVGLYGVVTVLGFAPILAAALARLGRLPLIAALGYTLVVGVVCVDTISEHSAAKNRAKTGLLSRVAEQPQKDWLIVFEARQDFVPLLHYSPDLAARTVLLDFEEDELANPNKLRVCGRDVGRRYAELYPRFRMMRLTEVLKHDGFYLVSSSGDPESEFDEYTSRHLGNRVYEMVRK